jgi:Rieske 2Fe-2S family protein
MKSALEPTLRREFYLSDEIFSHERERIFHSQWFCSGRSEELPSAGDWRLVAVAGEEILVVRAPAGQLHAFYNLCRHRGCRLVLEAPVWDVSRPGPHGTFAGGIRCPYHSWTYTLAGSLRTAPFLNEGERFFKEEFSLYDAGVQEWGGFFFLNLEPQDAPAQSLLESLGPIADRVKRYPLAELAIARRLVYDVNANWKVILENYNECYHCGGVHPELCEIVPAFKKAGGAGLDWDRGIPHKEGAFTFTRSGTTARAPFPGLNEDERTRHKGELIYPNLMLSLAADHVAAFTLWPRSPHQTTIACDFLFHRDEMAKPGFDPSDAVEFWDLVNRQDWRICEGVQRGMQSRKFRSGFYAPMESLSLDIRRYVRERLGTLDPDTL